MVSEELLNAMFDEQAKRFKLGLQAVGKSGVARWSGFAVVGIYRLFWTGIGRLSVYTLMSWFYASLGMTLFYLSLVHPESRTALDVLFPTMLGTDIGNINSQAVVSAVMVFLGLGIALSRNMLMIFVGTIAGIYYAFLVVLGVMSGAITFLGITAVITVLFAVLGLASSASREAGLIESRKRIKQLTQSIAILQAQKQVEVVNGNANTNG
jgi:hypothetical protein